MTVDGLKTSLSSYGPSEAMARALSAVERLGLTVLARIDHAAAATKVGMQLPTEAILFGNSTSGTPLKLLVWQDEQERDWIAYNDPFWLAAQRTLSERSNPFPEKMAQALTKIVAATSSTSKP